MKAKLLWPKGVMDQMRVQIEVMCSQPKRGPQNDLVKNGRQGIDDQIRPASSPHNGPKIARVRLDDFDFALLAEEMARPFDIAVAAPDDVPLSFEELSQQGACAACSQDTDPQRLANESQPLRRTEQRSCKRSREMHSVLLTTRKGDAYHLRDRMLSEKRSVPFLL